MREREQGTEDESFVNGFSPARLKTSDGVKKTSDGVKHLWH